MQNIKNQEKITKKITIVDLYDPSNVQTATTTASVAESIIEIIPFVEVKKKPKVKINKEFSSIPTSLVTNELIHESDPIALNRIDKTISGEKRSTGAGEIYLSTKVDQLNEYNTDIEILNQYSAIGLSRESFQIYLALIATYILNVPKSKFGKVFEISTKDFHNQILENENRLRKKDIEKYRKIFSSISMTRITINCSKAEAYPFKKRTFKNMVIDSNLMILDIITDNETYSEQIIQITPTTYTMFELKQIRQISNYFPKEFISLRFDKHDNILYFGFYLCRMHNINRDKENFNTAWETSLKQLAEKAIPKGEKTITEYNKTAHKSQFILREIINPLKEAIEIMKKHGYIVKYKIENLNTKKLFSENEQPKLKLIFQYDKAKIIKLEN